MFVYRWPQHIFRSSEYVCAHHHVHILFVGRTRPQRTEIPLVEKIFDHPSNDTVLGHHGSRISIAVHRLQLPEGVRLVDRHARRYVFLPFQGVLQTTIFNIAETKGKKSSTCTTAFLRTIFINLLVKLHYGSVLSGGQGGDHVTALLFGIFF